MKARFVVPFILCMAMALGSAGAAWGNSARDGSLAFLMPGSPYQKVERLNETAAALYAAAYNHNRQAAYVQLMKLQKQLDDGMIRSFGTDAGWRAMEQDAAAVAKALESGAKNTRWLEHVVRIRLAADAVASGDSALWLQYEKVLADDLSRVRQAWRRSAGNNADAAGAMLKGLSERVSRVEAAAMMAGDALRAEELRQRVRHTADLLEAKRKQQRTEDRRLDQSIEASIAAIDSAALGMFGGDRLASAVPAAVPPAVPHPLQWTLFIGTIVSAVLAWTGWRKYKQSPYGVKPLE